MNGHINTTVAQEHKREDYIENNDDTCTSMDDMSGIATHIDHRSRAA